MKIGLCSYLTNEAKYVILPIYFQYICNIPSLGTARSVQVS
jgi:hypothetical protein